MIEPHLPDSLLLLFKSTNFFEILTIAPVSCLTCNACATNSQFPNISLNQNNMNSFQYVETKFNIFLYVARIWRWLWHGIKLVWNNGCACVFFTTPAHTMISFPNQIFILFFCFHLWMERTEIYVCITIIFLPPIPVLEIYIHRANSIWCYSASAFEPSLNISYIWMSLFSNLIYTYVYVCHNNIWALLWREECRDSNMAGLYIVEVEVAVKVCTDIIYELNIRGYRTRGLSGSGVYEGFPSYVKLLNFQKKWSVEKKENVSIHIWQRGLSIQATFCHAMLCMNIIM